MYCKRARLLSSDPRLFIHSFMNGKFMVKKQERQNIFPSAGAGALTSNFTLSPAPPSMKKLRSKGFYLVISLRHCRVTWGTHARCWSVCLQYCEWILPFFNGNLQQHHFIFIVYYRGRKVSSSFLWLTSFFPQSGRFTSNIFDEDTTPTVHAAGTADEGQNEGVTCPYCTLPPVSSVLLFSYITHVEYWSATRKRISCDSFVPDWWQDRIVIKLQLTGKSRLILCLFSNFCVFSFNIR